MKLPENIEKILNKLVGSGFEAFVVGGCVRDFLMGKPPADYDIATNALPREIADCFKDYRVIETGIKHGTVTVVTGGENIEITTYRVDGEYLDNRRPQSVCFTRSLKEDLARRDFTMNAIAFTPKKGIIDPFDGGKDIKNKLIRCVGDPDRRFNEDALRILRALRFASQTGFEIEEKTAQSIFDNKNLIKNLSAERIFSELKKLICGENARKIITDYKEVIGVFIPEILPMAGFEQNTKYHCFDVFEHTLVVLENSENDVILRLAALLHDIGKPAAFYEDKNKVSHFKGHALVGAQMARNILNRLKSDNNTKDTVCALIAAHAGRMTADETEVKLIVSEKGFEFAEMLLKLQKADASAKTPEYSNLKELEKAEKILGRIKKSDEPLFFSDLKVNGGDIAEIGFSGRQVGEILKKLLYAVLTGQLQNDRMQLIRKAEEYLNNHEN